MAMSRLAKPSIGSDSPAFGIRKGNTAIGVKCLNYRKLNSWCEVKMDRDHRLDMMRDVWGPPPTDPVLRSDWDRGNELKAKFPEVIAQLVEQDNSQHPTLTTNFGTLLPMLEGEVVWQHLLVRARDHLRDAVLVVLRDQPWQSMIAGVSPVNRTRIADRLADDVANNLGRVAWTNPEYRAWLLGW